jgi:hypothetical protein
MKCPDHFADNQNPREGNGKPLETIKEDLQKRWLIFEAVSVLKFHGFRFLLSVIEKLE